MKASEEVVEFIVARGPWDVVEFNFSEAARQHFSNLIEMEKNGDISPDEKAELDRCRTGENLMRLAKARALQLLARG